MKRLALFLLLSILTVICCACRPASPLSGEEQLALEAVRAAKDSAIQQGAAPQDLTLLAVHAGRQRSGTLVFAVLYRLANQPPNQAVRVFYQIAGTSPTEANQLAARQAYLTSPIRYPLDIQKCVYRLEIKADWQSV